MAGCSAVFLDLDEVWGVWQELVALVASYAVAVVVELTPCGGETWPAAQGDKSRRLRLCE